MNFKVYIGDDASPEDCKFLLEKYKDKFDFVYHRFLANLGQTSLTRHWDRSISLIEEPTVEWLMILGDDDVLGENVVEEFYKNKALLYSEKSNLLKFATVIIDHTGKNISKIYTHPVKENAESAYYRKYTWETRSSLSEYVFKKSVYEKYRFKDYPLAWHSDDKAWLDFSENTPIIANNNAIIKIRISKENISGKQDNLEQKNKAKIMFFIDFCDKELKKYSSKQKVFWLFEFGDFIKKSNEKKFSLVYYIFMKFCSIFKFIDGVKFLRRMFWVK